MGSHCAAARGNKLPLRASERLDLSFESVRVCAAQREVDRSTDGCLRRFADSHSWIA